MKLSSSVSIFISSPHPVIFLLLSCAPAQIAPFDRFSCFMAQNTLIREIDVQKINILHYFFAQMREIPIYRNVKLQSAITPVLRKIGPCSLRIAGGFRKWRIEWFDRRYCHVIWRKRAP